MEKIQNPAPAPNPNPNLTGNQATGPSPGHNTGLTPGPDTSPNVAPGPAPIPNTQLQNTGNANYPTAADEANMDRHNNPSAADLRSRGHNQGGQNYQSSGVNANAFLQAFDQALPAHDHAQNAAHQALGLSGPSVGNVMSGLCNNWSEIDNFINSVSPWLRFIPGLGNSLTVVLAVLTAVEKTIIPAVCPTGTVPNRK